MLTVELVESGLEWDSFDEAERGLRMGAWEEQDELDCVLDNLGPRTAFRGLALGLSVFLSDEFDSEDELVETMGSRMPGWLIQILACSDLCSRFFRAWFKELIAFVET
ncbi:hypothetical protein BpHYR1_025011 [Brachionus plicatilis]|uniref:Uncharacterized protein n=1 Tax=Brachionus plicatilis TaxID=10195 RepID=A0A3M7RZF6_BRAPC|nr:hypothetical protein BpHYR1_025011 [Brachionus plicatilis]